MAAVPAAASPYRHPRAEGQLGAIISNARWLHLGIHVEEEQLFSDF